jgi:hypothetical protein
VKAGRRAADIGEMTPEQMNHQAQQAERLLERYRELEREREAGGLYEGAMATPRR